MAPKSVMTFNVCGQARSEKKKWHNHEIPTAAGSQNVVQSWNIFRYRASVSSSDPFESEIYTLVRSDICQTDWFVAGGLLQTGPVLLSITKSERLKKKDL